MLTLLQSKNDKLKAQGDLVTTFQKYLKDCGKRRIGFRVGSGGTNPSLSVYSNGTGKIWFSSMFLEEQATPRYWNAFGLFDPARPAQAISVELNIAPDKNTNRVGGSFASDPETGRVYLLHSGRIGGGKVGIGKSAFLRWSKLVAVPVKSPDGSERLGIILGEPGQKSIIARVEAYVKLVSEFKEGVTKGTLDLTEFRNEIEDLDSSVAELNKFNSEFFGTRKGYNKNVLDYVCHHGEIVNALHDWRSKKSADHETVFNSFLIDLGVKNKNKLTEIYEIKTGAGRQAIYTAVGQLMLHSEGQANVRKTMVLPAEESLPKNVESVLSKVGINIIRFSLEQNGECTFGSS